MGKQVDSRVPEQLLLRYLDNRGWRYLWEEYEFARKYPDAVVLDEEGNPRAVYEVTMSSAEDIRYLIERFAERISEGSVGFASERRHRRNLNLPKLFSGIVQRKEEVGTAVMRKGLPFLLVTYPNLPPMSIANTKEMTKFRWLSGIASIGQVEALDVLKDFDPSDNALFDEHRKLLSDIVRLLRERWGYEAFRPASQLPRDKKGIISLEYFVEDTKRRDCLPSLETVALNIWLNPKAQYPWPESLWGVYDIVYELAQRGQWLPVYDGRWELLKTYRMILEAGSLQRIGDASTSRSENFYEEREL
ncbi:MAG: hypothetical protein K6U12_07140 [Armatimonadetes bacterium]|jgi:hypothetical protein|nr:hypothetical protein [Armatimonadota bacterium]